MTEVLESRDTFDDLNNMRKVVKRFPIQNMWKFANLASDKYVPFGA